MFWDHVAWIYDVFANGVNRKANRALCATVEAAIHPGDDVLECACGTGLLSGVIAGKCKSLVATDFSANMLKRAQKKYANRSNIVFEQANILQLGYPTARFDAVVAANVIHLLDKPYTALRELDRVCTPGGRIIIPTYMNQNDKGGPKRVSGMIGKAGADFKRAFTLASYQQFFADAGYTQVRRQGLKPDLVVGDFDSLGSVPEGEKIVRHPVMKDDTDMMYSLKECLGRGYRNFLILGATGGRLDHTVANLCALYYLAMFFFKQKTAYEIGQ